MQAMLNFRGYVYKYFIAFILIMTAILSTLNSKFSNNWYCALLQFCFVLITIKNVPFRKYALFFKSKQFFIFISGYLICAIGWIAQGINPLLIDRSFIYLIQVLFLFATILWFQKMYEEGFLIIYYTKLNIVFSSFLFILLYFWYWDVPSFNVNFMSLPIFHSVRLLNFELAFIGTLGCGLFLANTEKNLLGNFILFFAIGFVSFWTGGRMQIGSFYFSIFIFIMIIRNRIICRKLVYPVTAFTLGGLIFACLNFSFIAARLSRTFRPKNFMNFAASRPDYWQRSFDLAVSSKSSFIFGLGPDAFHRLKLRNLDDGSSHCVFFQILLEFGLIGIICSVLLLKNLVIKIKTMSHLKVDYFRAASLALFISFLFYSLVDEVFYYGAPLLMCMILLAHVVA